MKNTSPDFLAIGHLCRDKIPGGFLPGGAATYAGLLAARLGFSAAALTSFGKDFLFTPHFQGLDLEIVPSERTTVFENIYQNGRRIQFLHSKAADLQPRHLPAEWRQAKTVLLCPIADEVSFDFLDFFENAVVCACPQGWMRRWDASGKVSPKPLENWERLAARADIISMSESDVAGDWRLIEKIGAAANLLAVTQGERGATIFQKGRRQHFPAFPTSELDPTGAGDVFAAAFALKFSAEKNVAAAAAFAHAAASLCVEGRGVASVPDLKQVEGRLLNWAGSKPKERQTQAPL